MATWRQWVGATAVAGLTTLGLAAAVGATSPSGSLAAAPSIPGVPQEQHEAAAPALPAVTVHPVPPELLRATRSSPASQSVTQTVVLTVIAGPAAWPATTELP